jgi:hypothetical protein
VPGDDLRGRAACLTKPFQLGELIEAVRALSQPDAARDDFRWPATTRPHPGADTGPPGPDRADAHADISLDLVLTDVIMPGISVREFIDAVHATRPGLPAVLIPHRSCPRWPDHDPIISRSTIRFAGSASRRASAKEPTSLSRTRSRRLGLTLGATDSTDVNPIVP